MDWIVTVKQIVPDSELGKPHYDLGIAGEYEATGEDEEEALDYFHEHVAIACLDDFEVSIKPLT